MKHLIFHYLLILGLFFSYSCEYEKSGTIDPNLSAPFLSTVTLSHYSLNLDYPSPGIVDSLGNNKYQISINVTGKGYHNPSSPAAGGILKIFKPDTSSPFMKTNIPTKVLQSDTVSFAKLISFVLNRSDIGYLRFSFLLQTSSGVTSNIQEKGLLITRKNTPPRIEKISMPESITVGAIPSKDSSFLITANIFDSDGINDINKVYFYSLKPDSTLARCGDSFTMEDDGGEKDLNPPYNVRSGDLIAGDGIFSLKVQLLTYSINTRCPPPDTLWTQRGTYTFTFHAIDKSGALSDSVSQTIKVK